MSQQNLRVSGKKIAIPQPPQGYTFTPRPGGWIIVGTPQGERKRLMLSEVKAKFAAALGSTRVHGDISEDQRKGAGGGGSDADLVAQFPGKVRKILVQAGAQVDEGQPLMLLEAMKMEFAVKAPYAGKIAKIHVTEGQQLTPGTKFLDIDSSAGAAKNG